MQKERRDKQPRRIDRYFEEALKIIMHKMKSECQIKISYFKMKRTETEETRWSGAKEGQNKERTERYLTHPFSSFKKKNDRSIRLCKYKYKRKAGENNKWHARAKYK